jgi:hypothetical protein
MKAELVNFELWFIDSDERIQEDIDRATTYYALNDIKEAVNSRGIDTVVGMLFMDGFLHRDREEFYDVLRQIVTGAKQLGIKKMYMIVGTCHGYQKELDVRNIDIEIVDWNFGANHAYYSYKPVWNQIKSWNHNATKFMFLTGVPSRPNRIGVIKSLYKDNLLHTKGIWSFFPPWTDEDKLWCRTYCNDYTDEQYEEFLKECENKIDYRYEEAKDYSKLNGRELNKRELFKSDLVETSGHVDPEMFTKSLLSIISEGPSDGNQYEFFTEKLWRTIINNQPFILVEPAKRIDYAKSLGLKTFEEYTNYKITPMMSEQERIELVSQSVKYFFNNHKRNIEKINKDIIHNKKVLLDLNTKTEQLLAWLSSMSINTNTITKYLQTSKSSVYVRFPKGV